MCIRDSMYIVVCMFYIFAVDNWALHIEVVDSECCVVHCYGLHSVVGDVFIVVNINLCCTDKAKIRVYVGGQKGCLHIWHHFFEA